MWVLGWDDGELVDEDVCDGVVVGWEAEGRGVGGGGGNGTCARAGQDSAGVEVDGGFVGGR